MSLQFKPEDDFKINNIITSTANRKAYISTNGDGTYNYVYADENLPNKIHKLTNLKYDELEKLSHMDKNTLEIIKPFGGLRRGK